MYPFMYVVRSIKHLKVSGDGSNLGIAWRFPEDCLQMAYDPVGLQILTASAALIKLDPPYGFVAATDNEYANIRTFFQHTLVTRE